MLNRRKYTKALLLSLGSLIVLGACKKESNRYGDAPRITFESLSADSIQIPGQEALVLKFTFVDGNGDLVVKQTSGKRDIYLKDSRDTSFDLSFYLPAETIKYATEKTGVSGTCTIELPAAILKLRPDHPTRDTLTYEYYLIDKAGNESNRLKTSPIYLISR